jgi:hypothetical protein
LAISRLPLGVKRACLQAMFDRRGSLIACKQAPTWVNRHAMPGAIAILAGT